MTSLATPARIRPQVFPPRCSSESASTLSIPDKSAISRPNVCATVNSYQQEGDLQGVFSVDTKQPGACYAPTLHGRRVRVMLWIGAFVFIMLGLGWAIYFAYSDHPGIVALDLLLLAIGLSIAWFTHKRRFRCAFYLFIVNAWIYVCAMSWFLDIPTPAAPRSLHYYLLAVAACIQIYLRSENPFLRYTLTGICFLSFMFLGSVPYGYGPEYALPDSIRAGGTWINTFSASLTLYTLIHLMVIEIQERSILELDLRRAVHNGELSLVYQPQVDAHGVVLGAEALVRWQHPRHGFIPPGTFIALAEQSDLIIQIGDWVLNQACSRLASWQHQPGLQHLSLSVNVSAIQFSQRDYVQNVKNTLASSGAEPSRLKLELTESALARDIDGIVAKMKELRTLGVELSLDDFGTGFSSLSYLKRLPLQQIKIDQSFVRDLLEDPQDAAIVQTVVDLSRTLGFSVIAEGVETEGQRDALLERGCTQYQGYLFSRPLRDDAFEAYCLQHAWRAPLQATAAEAASNVPTERSPSRNCS